MIEINLDKYPSPKTFTRNGKEYLIDKVKKCLRLATEEEFVRQKTLDYLNDVMEIPYNAMNTEEPVAHFIKGSSKRMDIVIYGESTNKREILMVVECKAPYVSITEEVYNQAKKYAQQVDIPTIMVINGKHTDFLRRYDDNNYEEIIKPPKYDELTSLKLNTRKISEFKYERWNYDDLFDKSVYIVEYYLNQYIDPDIEEKYYPYVLNIAECLLDTTHTVKDLPFKFCKFIKDEGVTLQTLETPHPDGKFTGFYRSFSIEYDGKIQIISLGSSVSDAKTPNATIISSIADEKSKHNITFEYNLNKKNNMQILDKNIKLTHYGPVGTGKSGPIPSEEVVKYIDTNTPITVENGRVFLGNLGKDKLYYVDDDDFKEFLANYIEYVMIRLELKELKKNDKW